MGKATVLATAAVTAAGMAGVVPVALAQAASAAPTGHDGHQAVKTFKTRGMAHPASASGSNGHVRISILGSGLHVNRWLTSAWSPSKKCSRAESYVNGKTLSPGNLICNPPYRDSVLVNYTFKGSAKVCNTWTANVGKPCESIHK